MSRALHDRDLCELRSHSLQAELDEHLHGEVLVIAPEDDRLKSLIPIKGQATLTDPQLDFGDTATLFTAPLYKSQREQSHYLPHSNDERFHFETNSFDTVVSMFSLCGYFQRSPPFLDMTRIARPGGTLLSITGLQPEASADHDAKWWVPRSDDADLETISVLRHNSFQTPIVLSAFTVTGMSPRHPDATIVTN